MDVFENWSISTNYEFHRRLVKNIIINKNGTLFLFSYDQIAFLYNLQTGEEVDNFSSPKGLFSALAIDDYDKTIVTGSFEGSLLVWKISQKIPTDIILEHKTKINALMFRPNSDDMLAITYKTNVRCISIMGKSIIWNVNLKSSICNQQWTENGHFLVVGLNEGIISVIDIHGSQHSMFKVNVHIWLIDFLENSMMFKSDCYVLLLIGRIDNYLSIYDTFKSDFRMNVPLDNEPLKVKFSDNKGQFILVLGSNLKITLWSSAGFKIREIGNSDLAYYGFQFSLANSVLVSLSENGKITKSSLAYQPRADLNSDFVIFLNHANKLTVYNYKGYSPCHYEVRGPVLKFYLHRNIVLTQKSIREMTIYQIFEKEERNCLEIKLLKSFIVDYDFQLIGFKALMIIIKSKSCLEMYHLDSHLNGHLKHTLNLIEVPKVPFNLNDHKNNSIPLESYSCIALRELENYLVEIVIATDSGKILKTNNKNSTFYETLDFGFYIISIEISSKARFLSLIDQNNDLYILSFHNNQIISKFNKVLWARWDESLDSQLLVSHEKMNQVISISNKIVSNKAITGVITKPFRFDQLKILQIGNSQPLEYFRQDISPLVYNFSNFRNSTQKKALTDGYYETPVLDWAKKWNIDLNNLKCLNHDFDTTDNYFEDLFLLSINHVEAKRILGIVSFQCTNNIALNLANHRNLMETDHQFSAKTPTSSFKSHTSSSSPSGTSTICDNFDTISNLKRLRDRLLAYAKAKQLKNFTELILSSLWVKNNSLNSKVLSDTILTSFMKRNYLEWCEINTPDLICKFENSDNNNLSLRLKLNFCNEENECKSLVSRLPNISSIKIKSDKLCTESSLIAQTNRAYTGKSIADLFSRKKFNSVKRIIKENFINLKLNNHENLVSRLKALKIFHIVTHCYSHLLFLVEGPFKSVILNKYITLQVLRLCLLLWSLIQSLSSTNYDKHELEIKFESLDKQIIMQNLIRSVLKLGIIKNFKWPFKDFMALAFDVYHREFVETISQESIDGLICPGCSSCVTFTEIDTNSKSFLIERCPSCKSYITRCCFSYKLLPFKRLVTDSLTSSSSPDSFKGGSFTNSRDIIEFSQNSLKKLIAYQEFSTINSMIPDEYYIIDTTQSHIRIIKCPTCLNFHYPNDLEQFCLLLECPFCYSDEICLSN